MERGCPGEGTLELRCEDGQRHKETSVPVRERSSGLPEAGKGRNTGREKEGQDEVRGK